MAYWVDAFQGNKLNPKWVSYRSSEGGEATGTWTQEVRDGKFYWKAQAINTESGWWGEFLKLPLNAPGDVVVEALIRLKAGNSQTSSFGIGVNQVTGIHVPKYGAYVFVTSGNWYDVGLNNAVQTPFPGFPSKVYRLIVPLFDALRTIRLVRKNGFMSIYIDGLFVGSYAFATTITSVDICNYVFTASSDLTCERWVHHLSVRPKSVVL